MKPMKLDLLKEHEYLPTGSVCEILGIGRTTLYKWRRDPAKGFPEPLHFGRRIVFSSAMLQSFIVDQERAAKKATKEKARLAV